jgi:hypothetical protein
LHADRADLAFAVVLGFQDHAVIIRGSWMLNFAEAEAIMPPQKSYAVGLEI